MRETVLGLLACGFFGAAIIIICLLVVGIVLLVTRHRRVWCAIAGHAVEPRYLGDTMFWHCWYCGKNFPKRP